MWVDRIRGLQGRKRVAGRRSHVGPHTYPCLAKKRGTCSEWDHCPVCSIVEQSIRAIRPHENLY